MKGEAQIALEALPLPLDLERVRLYPNGCGGNAAWLRRVVLILSRGRAVALGNHVFLPPGCEGDPAVLAHELTHCGQYQAWGPWRYYTRGAVAQLRELVHQTTGACASPYAYQQQPGKPFDAYGMEQQAQMVEDRVRRARPPLTSGSAPAR